MKKFEIWLRGYSKQFNCPWSQLLCTLKGADFESAFRKHMKEEFWPHYIYNKEEQKFLGADIIIKPIV